MRGDGNPKGARLTRRRFLRDLACAGAAVATPGIPCAWATYTPLLQEASFYSRLGGGRVMCRLCPHACTLSRGELSLCRTRLNRKGTLYTLSYNALATLLKDPIAKGPLYHFLPAADTLSVATAGCNLSCLYCQNWQISQKSPRQVKTIDVGQSSLIEKAIRNGCRAVTFTYTEPVAFFEYMVDLAEEAHRRDLKTHVCTAAYIARQPLAELCGHMDVATVALKSFDENFYRKVCGGRLGPVLDATVGMKKAGLWLEIATLIVPTFNESRDEMRRLARWIGKNLGRETPLHISRFWPEYRLRNLPPTPVKVIEECREAAMAEGLHYVYVSNLPGHEGNNTFCPRCGETVVTRLGFKLLNNYLKNGRCPRCGTAIPGVWS